MLSVLAKDKKTNDFVLVPRGEYEKLLNLKKTLKSRLGEIKDIDAAIQTYLKEEQQEKLKVLRSLADLN